MSFSVPPHGHHLEKPSVLGVLPLYCIACLQRTERSTWLRLSASDLDLTFGRSFFKRHRGAFA